MIKRTVFKAAADLFSIPFSLEIWEIPRMLNEGTDQLLLVEFILAVDCKYGLMTDGENMHLSDFILTQNL